MNAIPQRDEDSTGQGTVDQDGKVYVPICSESGNIEKIGNAETVKHLDLRYFTPREVSLRAATVWIGRNTNWCCIFFLCACVCLADRKLALVSTGVHVPSGYNEEAKVCITREQPKRRCRGAFAQVHVSR